MAFRSAAMIPRLDTRLKRAYLENFIDAANFPERSCVTSGLLPIRSAIHTLTINYSAGTAIVDNQQFTIGAASVAATNNATTCVWVNASGTVETGATWPEAGTPHAKMFRLVANANNHVIGIYSDPKVDRDSAIGLNLQTGTLRNASNTPAGWYAYGGDATSSVAYYRGYANRITLHRPGFVYGMRFYGRIDDDKVTTFRFGFMTLSGEWLPGHHYSGSAPAGVDVRGWHDIAGFWFPTPPPGEYLFGTVAWEVTPDFAASNHFEMWALKESTEYYENGVCSLVYASDAGSTAMDLGYVWNGATWSTVLYPHIIVPRTYESPYAHYQGPKQTLAQPATRFIAAYPYTNADESGSAQGLDATNQMVAAEVSFDNGAHWTSITEAEELVTAYSGTELLVRVWTLNHKEQNTRVLSIENLGLFWEE